MGPATGREEGGGGSWHDAWLYCCLQPAAPIGLLAYWPLATYPCLFFEPSPSASGGAHRPLTPSCPPSPSLAYPHPPTHPLPFPREVVPPGLSLSHCSGSGPHGGGQLPSPLATCVQVDTHTGGWGGGGGAQGLGGWLC